MSSVAVYATISCGNVFPTGSKQYSAHKLCSMYIHVACVQVLPVGLAQVVCEFYVGTMTTDTLQLRLEAQLNQNQRCRFPYLDDSQASDRGATNANRSRALGPADVSCGTLNTASLLMPRQLLDTYSMYYRAGMPLCVSTVKRYAAHVHACVHLIVPERASFCMTQCVCVCVCVCACGHVQAIVRIACCFTVLNWMHEL